MKIKNIDFITEEYLEALSNWFCDTYLGVTNENMDKKGGFLWGSVIEEIKKIDAKQPSELTDIEKKLSRVKYIGRIYRRINKPEEEINIQGVLYETDYCQSWCRDYTAVTKNLKETVGNIYVHAKIEDKTFGINILKYIQFLDEYLYWVNGTQKNFDYYDRFVQEKEIVYPTKIKYITKMTVCDYEGNIKYDISKDKWFTNEIPMTSKEIIKYLIGNKEEVCEENNLKNFTCDEYCETLDITYKEAKYFNSLPNNLVYKGDIFHFYILFTRYFGDVVEFKKGLINNLTVYNLKKYNLNV